MAELHSTPIRSLDVTKSASIDPVKLNNEIVNMRPLVKKTKIQLINKLARHISVLKRKRGAEKQLEKNKRKAERLLEEIEIIKNLKVDRISKFSLANTDSFCDINKQVSVTTETRALARLAEHSILKGPVTNFRSKHEDWKALTAYLLTKNSGRRFKKKKDNNPQKVRTNVKAGEVLVKSYLEKKLGQQAVSKCSKDRLDEKNVPTQMKNDMPSNTKTSSTKLLGEQKVTEAKVTPTDSTPAKPVKTDKVVKKICIENLDKELPSPKKIAKKPDTVPIFLTHSSQEGSKTHIKETDHKSRNKDSFFMTSDGQSESEDENPALDDENRGYSSTDSEELNVPRPNMESSFLNSLADKKERWKNKQKNKYANEQKVKKHNEFSKQGNQWMPDTKPQSKSFKQQKRPDSAHKRKHSNAGSEPHRGETKAPVVKEKLHPSWEASKKKKEQLGKIQPFQGKRIKFDD
ncbi:hypothetical protein ScPMuIL_018159 [Solemya velum]